MNIEWDLYAIEDWQRLSLEDAARVARAVQQWAHSGAGLVEVTEGAGVYRLYWTATSFVSWWTARRTRCTWCRSFAAGSGSTRTRVAHRPRGSSCDLVGVCGVYNKEPDKDARPGG